MYCTNCGTKFEGNFCPNCGEKTQFPENAKNESTNTESNNSAYSKYYPEMESANSTVSTDNNVNNVIEDTEPNIGSFTIIKKQPWFSAKIVIGIISIVYAAFTLISLCVEKNHDISAFTGAGIFSSIFMLVAGIISVAKNNAFSVSPSVVTTIFYFISFSLSTQTGNYYSGLRMMGGLASAFCIVHIGSLIARSTPFVTSKWKKAVLIVLCIFVSFITFSIAVAGSNDTANIKTDNSAVQKEDETEEPTESKKYTEEKYKALCGEIDFETLSRNPNKYKGMNYVFTGQVIQVQEGFGNKVDLRINITKNSIEFIDEEYWTDTIYATVNIPDGEDRILEEDIITFWGECEGKYSYTSVLMSNITLPKINIKYFEIN
ncbi:MAG: hypothetical protein KBS62_02420 [Oscillospiraceae bacterium]|nr:hypothetical protein [Candidatus Ruminococcus equi]